MSLTSNLQTCCSSSSDDENAPKTNDDFVDFLGNDGVRFQPSNNNAKKKNKFQQWVPEQVILKQLSGFSVGIQWHHEKSPKSLQK